MVGLSSLAPACRLRQAGKWIHLKHRVKERVCYHRSDVHDLGAGSEAFCAMRDVLFGSA